MILALGLLGAVAGGKPRASGDDPQWQDKAIAWLE